MWRRKTATEHRYARGAAGRLAAAAKLCDVYGRVSIVFLAATLSLSPVTSAGSALPNGADAGCSKAVTQRVVSRFIAAYNLGDLERLDRLWAQEPDFHWYFVDDERERDAEDRKTLPLYFAERVALNDHLELRHLSINDNGTDFFFRVRRTTDDERFGARGRFHGKGATREVMSLPSPQQPIPARSCVLAVWAMDT